ncbi:S1C family serine protease [bacterium]|nr:S1C family serine protease [bacterium]
MEKEQNVPSEVEGTRHFERPTTERPPSAFNLSIMALFIGLLAGFGGYLLAQYIFPSNNVSYLNLVDSNKDIKINLEQPLTNVANKYQKSVAGVYRSVQAIIGVGQPLFSDSDFIGSAVVVTSDGWLMTTNQVLKNKEAKIILADKIYDIDEIREDQFTGAVFVKIDDNLLQPVNFQLTDNLSIGERLFTNVDLPNSLNHSFYATVLNNSYYVADKYLYSDEIDYYLQLEDTPRVLASPYFNMDGNLLGVSYSLGEEMVLLPAEYLKQAVKHLLNNTSRVELGLRYVDMENNSGFVRKGNLVYNPQTSPIVYNSSAFKAGLKAGDQIVSVNNDAISAGRTLTSIIQNYRQGDVVILKVLRNGLEQDMEVQL